MLIASLHPVWTVVARVTTFATHPSAVGLHFASIQSRAAQGSLSRPSEETEIKSLERLERAHPIPHHPFDFTHCSSSDPDTLPPVQSASRIYT